jgi:competence protein ComFB
MALRDEYDFNIIENTIKESVIDALDKEIDSYEICKCEECIMDMVCYALNRLKPNYSASLYGALYSRAEAENLQEEIKNKVINAIEIVSQNCSHDK